MRIRFLLFIVATIACSDASVPPAQDSQWAVALEPSMRIGAEYDFGAITGATRLPDGSLIVGSVGDFALHRFSATGAPTKKFARKGQGPGEITYLAALHRCGASLYTRDLAGDRITEFSLEGEYVRDFRFSEMPYRSDCNESGVFVHMGWERSSEIKEGAYREAFDFEQLTTGC